MGETVSKGQGGMGGWGGAEVYMLASGPLGHARTQTSAHTHSNTYNRFRGFCFRRTYCCCSLVSYCLLTVEHQYVGL